jgi:hypothetical protein
LQFSPYAGMKNYLFSTNFPEEKILLIVPSISPSGGASSTSNACNKR